MSEEKTVDLDEIYKRIDELRHMLYELFYEIRDYYDLEDGPEDKLLDLTADAGSSIFRVLWVIKELRKLKRLSKSKI